MSEKRRDHKNRILKNGESQRKDLLYMYRYTDQDGKRRSVYARTLEELRAKEAEIEEIIRRGTIFDANKITVADICERYLSQNYGAKTYSRQTQKSILNRIKSSYIADKVIAKVRTSVAKEYVVSLKKEGLGYGTIRNTHVFLKSVFQYAYEDDLIPKNPFDFRFAGVISGQGGRASGLTPAQQTELLKFISGNKCYSKRLDDVIILLGTGLRVGEFCALTKSDIDFEKRAITVDKQLQRYEGGVLRVVGPKTASGVRMIPMSDDVYDALKRVVERRSFQKVEPIIDGHVGFLFLTTNHTVATNNIYESYFRRVQKAFNDSHTIQIRVTPHVLRHSYCSNLVRGGIDPASLMYLMGHSNAVVSLNVYTDKTFESAEIAYKKAVCGV